MEAIDFLRSLRRFPMCLWMKPSGVMTMDALAVQIGRLRTFAVRIGFCARISSFPDIRCTTLGGRRLPWLVRRLDGAKPA